MAYPRRRYNGRTRNFRRSPRYNRSGMYRGRRRFRRRTFFKPGISKWNPSGNGIGISDAVYMKLRYHETIAADDAYYRGNSAFDPAVAFGGNSIPYFQRMSNLYGRYLVLGSSIKLTTASAQNDSRALYAVTCQAVVASGAINPNNLSEALMDPNVKVVYNMPLNNYHRTFLKMFRKTKSVMGVPKVTQEQDLSAPVTTNPAKEWYWQINVFPQDGSFSAPNGIIHVQIDYYIKFSRCLDLHEA